VLRGSGSSLYGSHAIGGVVNINSRQGGGRPHGDIRAEGGGLGMLRGVARAGGGLAQDRFTYSGGLSHLNVTEGIRGGTPHRNTSAQGFAKYSLAPNISLSGRVWGGAAFASLSESPAFTDAVLANFPASGPVPAIALPNDQLELFEAGRPFNAGAATYIPDQIDPDNRRESSFFAGALIFQHQLNPNASYRIAYQGVDTNRSFQDGPGGPGPFEPFFSNDSRFDGRIDLLQARTDLRLGQHNLVTVGYEFEREEYIGFNTDESPNPIESTIDIEQSSQAVFVQDQIRLLDGSLHIGLAGRAQFFDLENPFFDGAPTPYDDLSTVSPPNAYTGDASLAYFVASSQTKLRAHVGNAYRSPAAYERFGGYYSSFSSSFDFYGDPRLAPERSVAVDAGIDQWMAGGKARLSGTIFYTNLQETVTFDSATFPAETDPFGRFIGYRNGGGGIARGVEFSGQVSPTSSTSLQAAYTFTNSDSRRPQIAPDYFSNQGVSDHIFTLTGTQWIARRFNVTFDLFAASEYSLSPFGALGRRMVFDGPVKADVVLRYDIPVADTKTLEIYTKVENMFDNDVHEEGFATPGLWAIGGVRFRF
jgi:iron complex outermembrane receptor protein